MNPTGGNAPVYVYYNSTENGALINYGNETAGGDGIEQSFETFEDAQYDVLVDIEQNSSGSGVHTILVEVLDVNGNVLASDTGSVANNAGSDTVNLSFTAAEGPTTLRITNPTSTDTVSTDPIITNADVSMVALPPQGAPDTSLSTGTDWFYEYYDLPGTTYLNLAQAGFTGNGSRDNSFTPTETGYTDAFTPSLYDTGDYYALKFSSVLEIETDGISTFSTSSDDGSRWLATTTPTQRSPNLAQSIWALARTLSRSSTLRTQARIP